MIISHKHSMVVRWGVALALAAHGKEPWSMLNEGREADILAYLASKGVRPSVVDRLLEGVRRTLRTMSNGEALYLVGLKSAPK